MSEGVAAKVSRGAVWMIASRLVDSGLGTVSTIVLARLLVPEDFGLVALGTSLAAMLELLRAFSFAMVLIQRQDAGPDLYDTAWTINALFSLVISVLLLGAATPLAAFYGDDRLVAIVWVIALAKGIDGFENIGVVNFKKEFLFSREFVFVALRRILVFATTVTLAFTLRSYWALVLGLVGASLARLVLSFLLHPYRPRFTMVAWRELIGFSRWLAINAVAHALAIRTGDFLIGKFAGMSSLGVFSLANELAFLPSSELGAPINQAVYPGYARAAHDLDRLRAAFYRVMSAISLLIVPVAVGLASVADSLVPLLLGDDWLAAIPLVPVLAVRGLIQALAANVPYVYLALGKPQLSTYTLVARVALLLPLLWIGLREFGLVGAVWAYLASILAEIPITLVILRGELQTRILPLVASTWRPLAAAGAMAVLVRWLSEGWSIPDATPDAILRLGALVAAGAICYGVVVVSLWWLSGRPDGGERMGLDVLRDRLGR